MAAPAGAVGGGAVPQVVVGDGEGAGLDHQRHLAADVAVGAHAVGGGVAVLGSRYDDGRPHVGGDVGRVIKAEEAVEGGVAPVLAVLMPVHVAGARLLAVPVAVEHHLVVAAGQADQRAAHRGMVEHLAQLRHLVADGVAGVAPQRIQPGGDRLVQTGAQVRLHEVVAVDDEVDHLQVVEQVLGRRLRPGCGRGFDLHDCRTHGSTTSIFCRMNSYPTMSISSSS